MIKLHEVPLPSPPALEFHEQFAEDHGGAVKVNDFLWQCADGASIRYGSARPTYRQSPDEPMDRWMAKHLYLSTRQERFDIAINALSKLVDGLDRVAAGERLASVGTWAWTDPALGPAPATKSPRSALATLHLRRSKLAQALDALLNDPDFAHLRASMLGHKRIGRA